MDPQVGEFVRTAANVILGWLLGVGSAAWSDWRKGRKRVETTKRAIASELREVAYRFVLVVFKLGNRHGEFDRERLLWIQSQVDRYAGPNPKDGVASAVAGLLKCSDEDLSNHARHLVATTPPSFVPTEDATYTTQAVGELRDHSPDYAVRVLDVLAHLRMYNEARDNALHNIRLTFMPELTPENHRRAAEAVNEAERQMAHRARIIVDKITALEGK